MMKNSLTLRKNCVNDKNVKKKLRSIMENIIKEWIQDVDYASTCEGKVLLSKLVIDFAQWCSRKEYDASGLTSHTMGRILTGLGYEKTRRGDGIVFIIK